MDLLQLVEDVKQVIPEWRVTVDEAYMVNVSADDIKLCDGFAYIEEFATETVDYARFGKTVTSRIDMYFCRLGDFESDAVDRVKIRQEKINPAVAAVERMLLEKYGVSFFTHDVYPRGFDANEVLIHSSFSISEKVC